jgi:hypothetical protein
MPRVETRVIEVCFCEPAGQNGPCYSTLTVFWFSGVEDRFRLGTFGQFVIEPTIIHGISRCMDLDLFLNLIKTGGFFVACGLGALGIIFETKDQNTGRLTKSGITMLIITIFGASLALTGELIQNHQGKLKEDKQDRLTSEQLQRTENLLAITTKSLIRTENLLGIATTSLTQLKEQAELAERQMDYVTYMVGKLDNIKVDAIFELPDTEFTSKILSKRIQQTITLRSGARDRRADYFDYTKGKISMSESVSMNDIARSEWDSQFEQDTNILRLLRFLRTPEMDLRIFKQNSGSFDFNEPDIFTSSSLEMPTRFISFSNKVIVECFFDFPVHGWRRSNRITCMPDLEAANVYFNLANTPGTPQSHFRPYMMSFKFGKTAVPIENFELLSPDTIRSEGRNISVYKSTLSIPTPRIDR